MITLAFNIFTCSYFQVGVFPKFSGEEFDNFTALAEKLRADYDFGHTLNAKLLPRGESSVSGPVVRLFKPFDELLVDSKVLLIFVNIHVRYLSNFFIQLVNS